MATPRKTTRNATTATIPPAKTAKTAKAAAPAKPRKATAGRAAAGRAAAKPDTPQARKAAAAAQGRRWAPAAELDGTLTPAQAVQRLDEATAQAEQATQQLADAVVTAEVTFRGRKVVVRAPSAESMAVMRRLARRFAEQETGQSDMGTLLKHTDRAMAVIATVLHRPEDKEWLEDEFLDGMTLVEALPLMRDAVTAINAHAAQNAAQNANRADRRAGAGAAAADGAARGARRTT